MTSVPPAIRNSCRMGPSGHPVARTGLRRKRGNVSYKEVNFDDDTMKDDNTSRQKRRTTNVSYKNNQQQEAAASLSSGSSSRSDSDGVCSPPSTDTLAWNMKLSMVEQRRNVAVGQRVKVRFADLNWYGGIITGVASGGTRVRIKYDDGTSEIASFPDDDMFVDDEGNGRHRAPAGVFEPPVKPRPALTESPVSRNKKENRAEMHEQPRKVQPATAHGSRTKHEKGQVAVGKTVWVRFKTKQTKYTVSKIRWYIGAITHIMAGGSKIRIKYGDESTQDMDWPDESAVLDEDYATDKSDYTRASASSSPCKKEQTTRSSRSESRSSYDNDEESDEDENQEKKKEEDGISSKKRPARRETSSIVKQKNNIVVGQKLKVRFTTKMKRYGKHISTAKWYRGRVTRVISGGSKIYIKYDDGTSELADYPDEDIVLDGNEGEKDDATISADQNMASPVPAMSSSRRQKTSPPPPAPHSLRSSNSVSEVDEEDTDVEERPRKKPKRQDSDSSPVKSIAVGQKVKVRFTQKIKRMEQVFERPRWYLGVVTRVVKGGSRIHVRYRDGSTEVANYPDKDIVLDESEETTTDSWDGMFELFSAFKKIHGHCEVPADYEPAELNEWVNEQRNEYRRGVLVRRRRKLLESIGFDWTSRSRIENGSDRGEDSEQEGKAAAQDDAVVAEDTPVREEAVAKGESGHDETPTGDNPKRQDLDSSQRKSIAAGQKVKVRFTQKIERMDQVFERTRWYLGVVTRVVKGGSRIHMQYRDGSTEVANYPDKDIVLDESEETTNDWTSRPRIESGSDRRKDSEQEEKTTARDDAVVTEDTSAGGEADAMGESGQDETPTGGETDGGVESTNLHEDNEERGETGAIGESALGQRLESSDSSVTDSVVRSCPGQATVRQTTEEKEWDAMFERLLEYKREHGDCMVYEQYDVNPKLGLWVKDQRDRRRKGLLISKHEQRLESIGFLWDPEEVAGDEWDTMFVHLAEYKSEHGNCLVPPTFREYPQLGKWVSSQREKKKNGDLLPDRVEQLASIEFEWDENIENITSTATRNDENVSDNDADKDLKEKSKFDEVWDSMFARLKDYKAKHGNCCVSQRDKTDPRLGQWVNTQRKNKRQNTMPPDRVQRLESIEFEWDGRLRPANDWYEMDRGLMESSSEDIAEVGMEEDEKGLLTGKGKAFWETMFARLEKYKTKYGNCLVPSRYQADKQLGQWVTSQRMNTKKHLLSPDLIHRLESIGFQWDGRVVGTCKRVLSDNKDGGSDTEVGQMPMGNTKEYEEDKTGFSKAPQPCLVEEKASSTVVTTSERDDMMFARLEKYKAEHGNCLVPCRYRKDKQLGQWVGATRMRKKKNKLSPDLMQRLESIGFQWKVKRGMKQKHVGSEEVGEAKPEKDVVEEADSEDEVLEYVDTPMVPVFTPEEDEIILSLGLIPGVLPSSHYCELDNVEKMQVLARFSPDELQKRARELSRRNLPEPVGSVGYRVRAALLAKQELTKKELAASRILRNLHM